MKSHKVLTLFIALVILVSMIGIIAVVAPKIAPTMERGIEALKERLTGDIGEQAHVGKFSEGDPDQKESSATTPGEGPAGGFEAYLAAMRSYPADEIPPAVSAQAAVTFDAIASQDSKKGDPNSKGHKWALVGPLDNATQPGVTSFSGATNNTASRTTALLVDPKCGSNGNGVACRVWAGTSGGGVWRTENALADNPKWNQLKPQGLDQNTVGVLSMDPTDKKNNTIYLGTGEPNRCSSGCEAGIGIYKSTNGGNTWNKLSDACVSNGTYACVTPGVDAFLGRAIRSILVDPNDANHIFVGSAQAVRGLSHVIGNGGQTRLAPAANAPGLYESTDGGATFTMVWNGNNPASFGINEVGLDPLNPAVVYASAFDQGLWRRDAGAGQFAFSQVFAPQFSQGAGIDRTMFAMTVKNGNTRIYLTEGTQPATSSNNDPRAANFWRLDNANQPAATLLASQPAGATAPNPATHTFPAVYTGWQNLTSKDAGNPYFATDNFCTQQCWYDQRVYTPAGLPDTVYVLGSMVYSEQPCDTNGVGCGNGRSNGRTVLYSDTAGDPDAANNNRTFTDLTYDATINHPAWCAYAPYFDNGCLNAPNGIHPDEHVIAVNPGNPTQIFEGSDGGMIRTSGAFADISSQCDSPYRNGGGPLPTTSSSYTACKRLLSRVPTQLGHIDQQLSSTLQFIGVAINPASTCQVLAGTQDNGTWSNLGGCDNKTFTQVIYGDGGNAGFDLTNPTWMFNEYTGGFSDSNFEGGDPEKWVITSAPIVNSGEAVAFYWPQIADPNPPDGAHPIFSGAQHVWRTWAFGAGTPGAVPQDKNPNIAFYEANCPEFVTFGGQAGCGDYQPMGGDLTSAAFGSDRTGGSVSWLARDSADHGTLWASTSAGRIFVTHNADAVDPATVAWHRIDNASSPTRFPSGIYVDPADTGHAWISYSGYNAVTPTTPGHVFEVSENGTAPGSGVFTNLNVEAGTAVFPTPTSNGDLPVSDVVRDDSAHTLYVSTDFGVLRGDNDGKGGWHVTAGMPRYEVMHLEIQPSSRVATCAPGAQCKPVLYAATHSQGIWVMRLP
jgi:hypothetical protein